MAHVTFRSEDGRQELDARNAVCIVAVAGDAATHLFIEAQDYNARRKLAEMGAAICVALASAGVLDAALDAARRHGVVTAPDGFAPPGQAI